MNTRYYLSLGGSGLDTDSIFIDEMVGWVDLYRGYLIKDYLGVKQFHTSPFKLLVKFRVLY